MKIIFPLTEAEAVYLPIWGVAWLCLAPTSIAWTLKINVILCFRGDDEQIHILLQQGEDINQLRFVHNVRFGFFKMILELKLFALFLLLEIFFDQKIKKVSSAIL